MIHKNSYIIVGTKTLSKKNLYDYCEFLKGNIEKGSKEFTPIFDDEIYLYDIKNKKLLWVVFYDKEVYFQYDSNPETKYNPNNKLDPEGEYVTITLDKEQYIYEHTNEVGLENVIDLKVFEEIVSRYLSDQYASKFILLYSHWGYADYYGEWDEGFDFIKWKALQDI